MKILFGMTNKRKNSTRLVACTWECNGEFLDDINLMNPNIIFELDDSILEFNYAYIPEFHRYYFIGSPTILSNNRVMLPFYEDFLSTYKGTVESNNMIFDRTPYRNTLCDENLFPVQNKSNITKSNEITFFNDGYVALFLVDICNSKGGNNPTTTTYLMTCNELKEVVEKVFTPDLYGDAIDITGDIMTQTICNPMQYFTNVRFCPFRVSTENLSENKISFGWLDIDVSFTPKVVNTFSETRYYNFTVPNKPNSLTDSIIVYVPCFGTFEIPNIYYNEHCRLALTIDSATGNATVHVYIGEQTSDTSRDGYLLTILSGKVTCNYALSGIQNNIRFDAIKSAVAIGKGLGESIGLLMKGESFKDTLSNLSESSVNGFIDRKVSTISVSGDNIGEMLTYRNINVFVISTPLVLEHSEMLGHPNYIETMVSEHGYYKAVFANIYGIIPLDEKEELSSLLKSGFYYE